jgi:hypothetical protein
VRHPDAHRLENQLFNCIYFSGPCNDGNAGHGADAGAGD